MRARCGCDPFPPHKQRVCKAHPSNPPPIERSVTRTSELLAVVVLEGCARRARLRHHATAAADESSAIMTLLDQDAFLTRFSKALEESRSSGTVYVTFKRCACLPRRPPGPSSHESQRHTFAAAVPHHLLACVCVSVLRRGREKVSRWRQPS